MSVRLHFLYVLSSADLSNESDTEVATFTSCFAQPNFGTFGQYTSKSIRSSYFHCDEIRITIIVQVVIYLYYSL